GLSFEPFQYIFFLRNFTDRFDFAVHHHGRGAEHAVTGDFHQVGDFFNVGAYTAFAHGLFNNFFGLLAFGAAGTQHFNFHDFFLLSSLFQLLVVLPAWAIQAVILDLGGTDPAQT